MVPYLKKTDKEYGKLKQNQTKDPIPVQDVIADTAVKDEVYQLRLLLGNFLGEVHINSSKVQGAYG